MPPRSRCEAASRSLSADMPSLGTVFRTLSRLRPLQIASRPYARFAPALARRASREVDVDAMASDRIRRWAAAVIAIDQCAAMTLGIIRDRLDASAHERALQRLARETAALDLLSESHLAANHELAHHAAIATLRLLLGGKEAVAPAVVRYTRTLLSQIDADGLHEERSPYYHLLALADLRRLRAAAVTCGFEPSSLSEIDSRMAAALSRLVHPDGTLPMFHDSPAVVHPSPRELGIEAGNDGLADFSASGLFSWRGSTLHIVGEFGAPRPRHQPGHQHAAPFAIEIWWDGPFITPAGVTTYAAGERRTFERGAAAHATVRVNGEDPAEIGAAFRMGRGYEVRDRKVSAQEGGFTATGSHDGYKSVTHSRTIELRGSELTVRDRIDGNGEALIESFWPIAPGWSVERMGERGVLCRRQQSQAWIAVDGAEVSVEPFEVARRFGIAEPATRLIARRRASIPPAVVTRLRLEP